MPPAISWAQGFHKILKKHDKMLPHAPCQQFYVAHLHQQKWVQVRGNKRIPGLTAATTACATVWWLPHPC